ncbi:unnamed protein product [Clonostachys rosea f. rosea IK726]|uniref:Phosphatidylglycerol/phosphatidylinositol transfer protein n=2 Tax=Bionectria ochroleuca TaxID=29856 RepID=A0A0B7K1I7_BIOOC|nr:unnamed protein product [Clonostachys rosea f. rosea IK726]
MKFSAVACLSALAAPGLAASIGVSKLHDFMPATGSLKVPGESPAEFCNANRDGDLVQVQLLSTDPNPVKAGRQVSVKATLDVEQTITDGSYVKVVIKYGLIQLISTTADLCEQVSNAGIKCPIEAGKHQISFQADMPAVIPPGTYNVFADAYGEDDQHLTCMRATVNFPHPGQLGLEL